MNFASAEHRNGRAVNPILLLFVAICLGLLIPLTPGIAVPILAMVAVATLLRLSEMQWWKLWLAVVFVAAFGPFLDIVTGEPINWLMGLAVLAFFALTQVHRFLTMPRSAHKSNTRRHRLPVLGTAFLIYALYFFLQTVRPGVFSVDTLLAFRAPLIGLAAYFMTTFRFRSGMSQDDVMRLVQRFMLLLVIAGLLVAAYGLFQYVVGFDRLQAWGLTEAAGRYLHNQRNLDGGTTIFRIFGTMRRNETLGVFLYLVVVACAVSIQLKLRPRWLIWPSAALSSIGLLLSFSLTSLFTLGLWVALLILLSRSRRLILRGFMVALAAIMLALIINQLLDGLIMVRLREHVLDTQEGIGRVRMFQNWIAELSERSLLQGMFGSGICTGIDESTVARIDDVLNAIGIGAGNPSPCGWQRVVTDNWYATHSLEVGWLGLLLFWSIFLMLMVYTLPRLRRNWRQPEKGAWTTLAAGVLAIWPSGFVGALVIGMPLTLYFWSMVALLDVGTFVSAGTATTANLLLLGPDGAES